MGYRNLKNTNLAGKRVLARFDFNVPLEEGKVRDDTRIRAALPTIEYLLEAGCTIIILSHLGRPKGRIVPELRLDPVAKRLEELLGRTVVKSYEWRGPQVRAELDKLGDERLLLLENTRFDAGEEKNEPTLAKEWADLGDIFVNDAFGVSHRAHSSTVGLADYLPAVAGFLMEKELNFLDRLLEGDIERPYLAILGGAKVSDKIGVLESLLNRVDVLLLGGGMANTFLAAKGWFMGSSFFEEEKISVAQGLLAKAEQLGKKILLPLDLVITDSLQGQGASKVTQEAIPERWLAVDVGPKTLKLFATELEKARTILWNGPLGVFEVPSFAKGTKEMAHIIARGQGLTVVGGGDSVAAINESGVASLIDHISTGGGATLEYLEGKTLPGINVLREVTQ